MYHVHKHGGNSPWKCLSICSRSQDSGRVCAHMDGLEDRGSTDRARARKESGSQHAWDARLYFVARLLLLLCVDIHSDVLNLSFQGLIIWGTVMRKLAGPQCRAKSRGRCKPLAPSPPLDQGWHRNLQVSSQASALSILQHSQRWGQNNALAKLLLVLRKKWAEWKRCVVWAKREDL